MQTKRCKKCKDAGRYTVSFWKAGGGSWEAICDCEEGMKIIDHLLKDWLDTMRKGVEHESPKIRKKFYDSLKRDHFFHLQ